MKEYYQALRINVAVSGHYVIWSSTLTGFVLYRDTVDPLYHLRNQLVNKFTGGGDRRFRMYASLQANTTYILVVSMGGSNTMGPFSITSEGAASVIFTRLGKYQWILRDIVAKHLFTFLLLRELKWRC